MFFIVFEWLLFDKKIKIWRKIADTSFKYMIGYNDDDDVIRPLCIKLSKMIGFVKNFDNNNPMSFKVTDKKLLKKYTKVST